MVSPLDPRIRVRDALRALVEENPGRWDKPSLFVLRNRLLDRTGSDARPLAEFLLEALRRGWRDRLPGSAMETARFDATVAPFVLQWSRERFVQPEMARWAAESWAYALRVIDESQLRIAPPPKRESMAAMAARLNAGAAAAGAQTAQAASAVVQALGGGAPATGFTVGAGRKAPPMAGKGPQQPTGGRGTARSTISPPPRFNAPTAAYAPRARASTRSVPPWIPKALFGTLCVMAMAVVGRVAIANVTGDAGSTDAGAASTLVGNASAGIAAPPATRSLSGAPANSPSAAMAAPMPSLEAIAAAPLVSPANVPGEPIAGRVVAPAVPASAGSPTLADAPLPAGAAPTSARTVAPSLTGGVAILAPEKPGVPSITRGLLATGADSARMVFVQPARRAAGEGRRMASPSSATPITFDELHFENGDTMRGRVEVVRAGTVIFRDMRTGLRHEYRKDDIAEVITEFGTVVRFRGEAAAARVATGSPGKAGAGARAKPAAPGTGVRARGVAGRYRIRYAAATAVGSPECTQVWTRAPNAEDIAVVTHLPGADTLAVAFQGGDVFPSNVDPDGYFASTFRIVPDQARTMTALTTRLNGRFDAKGVLDLTVNIVFYRRLRAGELTCNVTVKASGQREK